MNVLLNCEEVELGSLLEEFKDFTNNFDPVVSSSIQIIVTNRLA